MVIREAKAIDATSIARVDVDSWQTTYTGIVPQDYLNSRSYEQVFGKPVFQIPPSCGPDGLFTLQRMTMAVSLALQERVVFIRHGFRNALVPMIKYCAAQLPVALGAVVLIEPLSVLPGIGHLFLAAIRERYFPTIAGTLFILACLCLTVFLVTDIACAWLDPRIRSESLQEKFEYL